MRLRFIPSIALIVLLGSTGFAGASEIENPPIPPKRPAVLRASQAYIEELRARVSGQQSTSADEADPLAEIYNAPPQTPQIELKKESSLSATPPAEVNIETLDTDLAMNIKDTSREDILRALDGTSLNDDARKVIPKPKPAKNEVTKVSAPIPQKIEPAAGEPLESANNMEPQRSKLVSFYMQPEQIKLDENLNSFLQNHALKLMNDDNDLDIEIRSYATAIKDEEHSDVRISLARALEVRTFLMNSQIDPSRLKLKPITNYDKKDPDDRIDLVFVKRP